MIETTTTNYDEVCEEEEISTVSSSMESVDYMSQLSNNLVDYYIIPDLLEKSSHKVMFIQYPSRARVLIGNHLLPEEVVECPTVTWETEENCLYSIMMIDLDSPTSANNILSPWLHWLIINVSGSNLDLRQADLVAQYVGVSPPIDSGIHRYVFLAFVQVERITLNKFERDEIIKGPNMRSRFSVTNFVKDRKLIERPAACNFFLSQWTEFLPDFNEKLTQYYPETNTIIQNITQDQTERDIGNKT